MRLTIAALPLLALAACASSDGGAAQSAGDKPAAMAAADKPAKFDKDPYPSTYKPYPSQVTAVRLERLIALPIV